MLLSVHFYHLPIRHGGHFSKATLTNVYQIFILGHFLVFLQIAIFFQNFYNGFLMTLEHHQVYFKLHHTCHILIYSISSLLLTSLCLPSCLGQSFVITELCLTSMTTIANLYCHFFQQKLPFLVQHIRIVVRKLGNLLARFQIKVGGVFYKFFKKYEIIISFLSC